MDDMTAFIVDWKRGALRITVTVLNALTHLKTGYSARRYLAGAAGRLG